MDLFITAVLFDFMYVRWPEYWFLFFIKRYTTLWYKTATALSEILKKIICSSLTALFFTVFQMKYPWVNLFKTNEVRKWVVSSSEIILFLFGESTKSYISDWGLEFSVTTSPFVWHYLFKVLKQLSVISWHLQVFEYEHGIVTYVKSF